MVFQQENLKPIELEHDNHFIQFQMPLLPTFSETLLMRVDDEIQNLQDSPEPSVHY
jgi:hypothetical protein